MSDLQVRRTRKRPPVRKTSTLVKKHFVALNTKPSMVWDEEKEKSIILDDETRHNRGILKMIHHDTSLPSKLVV